MNPETVKVWHAIPAEEVQAQLRSAAPGLSAQDPAQRLATKTTGD